MTRTQSPDGLTETDLDPDPIRQFEKWFNDALQANLPEPTAMTLATASKDGIPSARIVLLKEFDARGFVFYTNHLSQKGRELSENPKAALVFFWPALERQIRISGEVTQVSREESERYFCTRPFSSRCGAWASRQSEVLKTREELEQRVNELLAEFEGKEVPLPPHWGGYRVAPQLLEFWLGRPSRLHDRFRYTRLNESTWKIHRLFP